MLYKEKLYRITYVQNKNNYQLGFLLIRKVYPQVSLPMFESRKSYVLLKKKKKKAQHSACPWLNTVVFNFSYDSPLGCVRSAFHMVVQKVSFFLSHDFAISWNIAVLCS